MCSTLAGWTPQERCSGYLLLCRSLCLQVTAQHGRHRCRQTSLFCSCWWSADADTALCTAVVCACVQVTAQRDGARLLVTLESKQAERLDTAVQRFQELLQPGAVLGVQQDVSSLSGQSGKHSVALLPEKGLAGPSVSKNGSSTTAVPPAATVVGGKAGVQQMCGVTQAAAAAGLADGSLAQSCTGTSANAAGDASSVAVLASPLLSD